MSTFKGAGILLLGVLNSNSTPKGVKMSTFKGTRLFPLPAHYFFHPLGSQVQHHKRYRIAPFEGVQGFLYSNRCSK